jgi:hypothetical protein
VTNAEVERLRESTGLDRYDAKVLLQARELLAQDPEHPAARAVVEGYANYFAGGEEPRGFEEFLLPVPYTVEELAGHREIAARHRACHEAHR